MGGEGGGDCLQLRERPDGGSTLVACDAVPRGQALFAETPYAAVQSAASRRDAPACAHCIRPLGLLAGAAFAAAAQDDAAAKGSRRRAALAAALAPAPAGDLGPLALPALSGYTPPASEAVACGAAGCADLFCSAPCRQRALAGWHGLLCCGSSASMAQFRRHAARTRDFSFALAARCLATALVTARDAGGARADVKAAATTLLALRSGGTLWDVVAAADARQHAAGGVKAAKAAKQRGQSVREQVEESHALLLEAMRLRNPAMFADDKYGFLTEPTFYALILGALEACCVTLRAPSPLVAYCAALGGATRAEQVAALAALRPVVEAASRHAGMRLVGGKPERFGSRRDAEAEASSGSDEDDTPMLDGDDESPRTDHAGGDASPGGIGGAASAGASPRGDADAGGAHPAPAFGCLMLCGGPRVEEAPPQPGLIAGWASGVATAVSAAMGAGGVAVLPAAGAATQQPGILAALACDGAAAAAEAEEAPPAPCGVRWEDAPERVVAAVAALAPAIFADVEAITLPLRASALSHSCVPSVRLEAAPDGDVVAMTTYDLAPGDEATLAYFSPDAPLATRRHELARRGIACVCTRCCLDDGGGAACAAAAQSLTAGELHALARQATAEGRHDDADALLRRVLAGARGAGAEDGEAAHALGLCFAARGRWSEAHEMWAAWASACPQHAGLRAQAVKAARFWPAPGAPSQLASATTAVVPSEGDWFTLPLEAPPGSNAAVATRTQLLAEDDCLRAVEAAEAAAAARGGWAASRSFQPAVSAAELPVHAVPGLLAFFNDAMRHSVAPLLAAAYPDEIRSASRVRVHDALVVRYSAGAQRSLPVHADAGQFSLTIALNPRADFEGGGTYFEAARTVLCPDVGHVVGFRAATRHGGEPLTAGVRYIIAAFCYLAYEEEGGGGANNALQDQDF